MRPDLETALDQCLLWMRDGESIEGCLARHSDYDGELRPLLELVADVGRVLTPPASAAARADGEQRMLGALAQKRARDARTPPVLRQAKRLLAFLAPRGPFGLRPAWRVAAVLLAVLVFAASAVSAAASAGSLPGDVLYPVKLAGQRVQLALTLDITERQLLHDRFSTQLRLDAQAALGQGRRAAVRFEGVLQRIDGTSWIVGGLPVKVQAATEIVGQPRLGAQVWVRGFLPGDGQLLATQIRVESSSAPTESPEPTATPEPTGTPEPTDTPQPASTPEPTPTLERAGGAEREGISEPMASLEPVQTPAAVRPAGSTAEPEPTEALAPAGKPEPTDDSESAQEPDPTRVPEAADEADPAEETQPAEASAPADEGEPPAEKERGEEAVPAGEPETGEHPGPGEEPGPPETAGADATPDRGDSPEHEDNSAPEDTPEPEHTSEVEHNSGSEDAPGQEKTPEPDQHPESEGNVDPGES